MDIRVSLVGLCLTKDQSIEGRIIETILTRPLSVTQYYTSILGMLGMTQGMYTFMKVSNKNFNVCYLDFCRGRPMVENTILPVLHTIVLDK